MHNHQKQQQCTPSSLGYADPFSDDAFPTDGSKGNDLIGNGNSMSSDTLGPNGINADDYNKDQDDVKVLESAWRFWLEKPLRRVGEKTVTNISSAFLEDKDRLRTLFEFKTVQGFWRCYNATAKDVDSLGAKEFLHLMRKTGEEGIRPLWEDPHNENGGEWVLRVPKDKIGDVWRDMLLACIGEQLSNRENEICGVSVSPRAVDYVVQVWVKNEEDNAILERIKKIIGDKNINSHFFRKHK